VLPGSYLSETQHIPANPEIHPDTFRLVNRYTKDIVVKLGYPVQAEAAQVKTHGIIHLNASVYRHMFYHLILSILLNYNYMKTHSVLASLLLLAIASSGIAQKQENRRSLRFTAM
jgi:hypothetical protein